MSLYLKRLVSGGKARFRDDGLGLELDLAYVTDRIIVMGFPAVGVESIYRNHRADVQRFLSARHGSNFWVFNFCPVRENAYHERVFQGRVSRYPFPDHHVPPFSYLSLVSREIHAWLSGSDARVAVLHCKAGKGRSGTLACAYLLFLYASSSALTTSSLHNPFSEWSLVADKEGLATPSENTSTALPIVSDHLPVRPASVPSGATLSRVSSEPGANTLGNILDLHTSRRMKPSTHHSRHRKPKMGVSIPSQQRWLSYWSQVLANKGPPAMQFFSPKDLLKDEEILLNKKPHVTKVKLTKLTVRMRGPSRMQPHLVQAASIVVTSTGKRRATNESTAGRLWASLSRYSDRLVDELERWEKESRNSSSSLQTSLFRNDRWDKEKMIRSFAQMSTFDIQVPQEDEDESRKPVLTYVLRPLDEAEADWVKLHESEHDLDRETTLQRPSMLESSFHASVSLLGEEHDSEDSPGIVLEANRELRIKLFIGEIPLGWVWVIPAFHMFPDSPSANLVLSNDDIDFAIGFGKSLVDVRISFAWHTSNEDS